MPESAINESISRFTLSPGVLMPLRCSVNGVRKLTIQNDTGTDAEIASDETGARGTLPVYNGFSMVLSISGQWMEGQIMVYVRGAGSPLGILETL